MRSNLPERQKGHGGQWAGAPAAGARGWTLVLLAQRALVIAMEGEPFHKWKFLLQLLYTFPSTAC